MTYKEKSCKVGLWDVVKHAVAAYNRWLGVNHTHKKLIMHVPYFMSKRFMKDLKKTCSPRVASFRCSHSILETHSSLFHIFI